MLNKHLQHSISPPGSTLYYALRRLPASQYTPCLGLFGLYRELQALLFAGTETSYVQFGWWYQEFERLLQGRPGHPLTRAVAKWPGCSAATPLEWLMGLEASVGVKSFDDENQLLALCSALGGPLFTAVHALTSNSTANTTRFMHDTGVAYTLFGMIQDLGKHMRLGVVPIPQTDLHLHQLNSDDVLHARDEAAFANLMQLQYERVTGMHYNVSSTALANRGNGLVAASIITAINRAVLAEIKRNDFDVVDHHVDITPLRKAWIAHSTYRKLK